MLNIMTEKPPAAGEETQKGPGGLKAALCMGGTCCLILIVVLVVIGLSGLGIAKIVMGAVHIHNCPINYLIPIYLIVAGCAPILLSLFAKAKPKQEEGAAAGEGEEKKAKCNIFTLLSSLGSMFNFAWLICGTVWVTGNWETVNSGCPGRTDCCNLDLMKFALAMVIIDWVLIGLIIIGACIACVCFCKAAVSMSGRDAA